MANIVINEISQNYTYNVGNNSYATVALPITACWGPGYPFMEGNALDAETALENTVWSRFPSTREGMEAFVAAFRGPVTNFRLASDYSYQVAMTLLASGYDILVCRMQLGSKASGYLKFESDNDIEVRAKYEGSFGNKLRVELRQIRPGNDFWSLIVYVEDGASRVAVENLRFAFALEDSSDTVLHISEVESNFIDILAYPESGTFNPNTFEPVSTLLGEGDNVSIGSDRFSDSWDASTSANAVMQYVQERYGTEAADSVYVQKVNEFFNGTADDDSKLIQAFKEYAYTAAFRSLSTLEDRLAYNPNRIIMPGWDDQNISAIDDEYEIQTIDDFKISPLHIKLMEVACYSRCATAYIDVPKSLPRKFVYEHKNGEELETGYAQMLSKYGDEQQISNSLYSTHSALFAPWGKYVYIGTSKQLPASPSFLALMIERSMIKNQTSQYEWELPTNRRNNLNIGKLDYNIPKKYLDVWQSLEGVGVNCITNIPGLGITIWGNSTLYSVPPATYQALANLSTRKLVNAVEDLAYKCGISITFSYNNDQAYNAFYAGMVPLLDTMRNVGAIEDYYVRMAEDVNGLDQVNANSVVGKIYLVIKGVINDITIDLICLPPQTDLDQFRV